MKVIRDEELFGLAMIPLMIDWHVSQVCQVKDCGQKSSTIVCFTEDETGGNGAMHVGICEKHYQEAKATGKFHYTILPKEEVAHAQDQ